MASPAVQATVNVQIASPPKQNAETNRSATDRCTIIMDREVRVAESPTIAQIQATLAAADTKAIAANTTERIRAC